MKKILTVILLGSLFIFAGCDSSDSVTEADAATKAAAGEINGKIVTVLNAAGTQLESGAESGSGRATTIAATKITGFDGATVSGSMTTNGTDITADLTITFTDCVVSGTTLNGTITYHVEKTGTSVVLAMTGDVVSVHSGTTYKLSYKLNMNVNGSTVSYDGYIDANGGRVKFSGTGVA